MTKKTHLDQLNAEVTEAIFVAERLDNPVYLKSLGPLYPAHLQLRIQAWERVRKAEEALGQCRKGSFPVDGVALAGVAQAEETLKVLRKEAAYRGADYYACNDPEELQHESPIEALEAYLGDRSCPGPGESLRNDIKACAPIEVTAYTRKEVPEAQIRRWTERMVEDLEENVAEEYGGPDGLRLEGKEALTVEIMAAARKSINATHIWQCDQVGTREYSEEELLEMFKEDIEEEEAHGEAK